MAGVFDSLAVVVLRRDAAHTHHPHAAHAHHSAAHARHAHHSARPFPSRPSIIPPPACPSCRRRAFPSSPSCRRPAFPTFPLIPLMPDMPIPLMPPPIPIPPILIMPSIPFRHPSPSMRPISFRRPSFSTHSPHAAHHAHHHGHLLLRTGLGCGHSLGLCFLREPKP